MAKKIIIPPLVLERIYAMYKEGYSYRYMSGVTGFKQQFLMQKIKYAQIKRNMTTVNHKAPGKYDYKFDEPTAEGKMYAQYRK